MLNKYWDSSELSMEERRKRSIRMMLESQLHREKKDVAERKMRRNPSEEFKRLIDADKKAEEDVKVFQKFLFAEIKDNDWSEQAKITKNNPTHQDLYQAHVDRRIEMNKYIYTNI